VANAPFNGRICNRVYTCGNETGAIVICTKLPLATVGATQRSSECQSVSVPVDGNVYLCLWMAVVTNSISDMTKTTTGFVSDVETLQMQ